MRDYEGLTEGVHPENPVFDVETANAALSRVNLYLDSQLHSGDRNDAMGDYDPRGIQSGEPGMAYFDEYVESLIDRMIAFGMDEESCVDFMSDCAREWIAQGMMDPVPLDDDPDIAFSMWVGKAQTSGFGKYLMQRVNEAT